MMSVTPFLKWVLLAEMILVSENALNAQALSMGYYAIQCPLADFIVRNTVTRALQKDPTLSGPLLRMHFHDCFVEGCDGSILIDSTRDNKAEKDSLANLSLRGYEIIDEAKKLLESQCPGVVSCADILAMAARDAVSLAGGPLYDIPKGRMDGRRSVFNDTKNLPPPSFNSSALIKMFGQHGFTVQEMVALSGGHTLGVAHCASFKARLGGLNSSSNKADPSLDPSFARTLSTACSGGDNIEVPFDSSRTRFDNNYFRAVMMGKGLLVSDQTLQGSPSTKPFVSAYAMNQALFFLDFQRAMVKMGMLDIKEGGDGEVRRDCRRVN